MTGSEEVKEHSFRGETRKKISEEHSARCGDRAAGERSGCAQISGVRQTLRA
jgi:hypothetical protein